MALTQVSNGNTAQANDLNQVINILQQPSGGQEKGKYWLEGNGFQSGAGIAYFLPSLSRGATPVSVSIDTADQAPSGSMTNATPGTFNLTASGFHVFQTVTAATNNAFCGGNYTIQF